MTMLCRWSGTATTTRFLGAIVPMASRNNSGCIRSSGVSSPGIAVNDCPGKASRKAGDSAKSQFYLERVLALEPGHPDATALRARIAIDDGNLGFAGKILDDAILVRLDSPLLRETRAWVLHLDGDDEAALDSLAEAERLGSPLWRVAYNRGLIAEHGGDLDTAAEHYRACLEAQEYEPARRRMIGLGFPPPAPAQTAPDGDGV